MQEHLKRLRPFLQIMSLEFLTYYDVTKPVKLQVDTSKSGFRAVLIQSNMPVVYASKSLTLVEARFAQIEKELLAVVFGCNRSNCS